MYSASGDIRQNHLKKLILLLLLFYFSLRQYFIVVAFRVRQRAKSCSHYSGKSLIAAYNNSHHGFTVILSSPPLFLCVLFHQLFCVLSYVFFLDYKAFEAKPVLLLHVAQIHKDSHSSWHLSTEKITAKTLIHRTWIRRLGSMYSEGGETGNPQKNAIYKCNPQKTAA